MKKLLFKSITAIIIISGLCSCVGLKPYERIYVNDPEMQIGTDAGKNFENYVYSIREGATPAVTIVSSGGCGCN
jgi:hypothetical protein